MTTWAAILIAGPTTSGKSAIASDLAERLGGAVVNADSMQVYRDLSIITARPSPAETARVPHHLYGEVDAAENYSAGRYLVDATRRLASLAEWRILPVVTGGTGLYFRALTEGLSDMPDVPGAIRDAVRRDADGRGTPVLHAILAERDPGTAARLRPSDRQRILRALEIHTATGRPLSSFHDERAPGPLAGLSVLKIKLDVSRPELNARVDRRFTAMMEAGALEEVARLGARRLDPALPVMRAHGVPSLLAHLRGEMGLDEAVARGQADTRAYVKRQTTWARTQMPDWIACAPATVTALVAKAVDRSGAWV